jgi:hypothetical protein
MCKKGDEKMKKIGEYTVRGRLIAQETAKIQLFDGRFDTAYRVIDVKIAPASMTSGEDAFCYVATKEGIGSVNGQTWDWSNNVEIGWAIQGSNSSNTFDQITIVDPDNMVVEDLYITNSNVGIANYMVKLEKYDISDWEGALTMIRNNAQNVE